MMLDQLMGAVERAFARTAGGLPRWDDPHPPPDRIVADEEYSRLTDPAKWRIIGARADAWVEALVANDLASVERAADVTWVEPPGTIITRTDLVTPTVAGGVPLVVCRSAMGAVDDAGVTLGVGKPAMVLTFIPDCGCDACDSGSQDVIDEIDTYLRAIVTGSFRRLTRRGRSITVTAEGMRQATNMSFRDDIDGILADPRGWHEVSGPAWLDDR